MKFHHFWSSLEKLFWICLEICSNAPLEKSSRRPFSKVSVCLMAQVGGDKHPQTTRDTLTWATKRVSRNLCK